MEAERWQKIKGLFDAGLELAPNQRSYLLIKRAVMTTACVWKSKNCSRRLLTTVLWNSPPQRNPLEIKIRYALWQSSRIGRGFLIEAFFRLRKCSAITGSGLTHANKKIDLVYLSAYS